MKLVFVETQNVKAHRNHRAEYLPFCAGLAERLGWEWRWLAVRVPVGHMHVGGRFVVDLQGERRRRLLDALAAEEPDVVVANDRPAERFQRALEEAVPGAYLVDLSDADRLAAVVRRQTHAEEPDARRARPTGTRELSVGEMVLLLTGRELDAGEPELASELLLDAVRPRFGRSYPCAEDLDEEPLPVRVVVPVACQHQRSLRHNPFFGDLDAPEVARHVGCSFCFDAMTNKGITYRVPLAEMALRQIEAEQRDEPQRRGRAEYLFEGNALNPIFDQLFEGLLERGLRPSTITGMLRVDQLLRLRSRLHDMLPRLEAAGHALRLLSMGAESFSPDENERFNKGLRTEQLEEAHELILDLEGRFPEAFGRVDASTFAAILFTPWTRPEDVLANVEATRRLGEGWLHTALGTRLQLRPGLPITALARRDGLVTEEHWSGADVEAVCLSGPDEEEVPWRFADPVTARIHQIVIRVDPVPDHVQLEPDDPVYLEIREICARVPERVREDHAGFVGAITRAVIALGPEAPLREVLGRAARDALLATGLFDRKKGLDEYGASMMVQLLGRVVPRNERHLRGYLFVEATPVRHGDSHRVSVTLQRGDEQHRFHVTGRYAGNTYRLEEDRFAVVFESEQEPHPDEIAVTRIVLRLAERSFPSETPCLSTRGTAPGRGSPSARASSGLNPED